MDPRLAVLLAVLIAGCSTNTPTKGRVPWWPQGPGNQDEVVAQAEAERQRQAEAPQQQEQQVNESVGRTASRPTLPRNPGYKLNVPAVTRYGDLYFLSGQVPDDAVLAAMIGERSTVERETQSVMDRIRATLAAEQLTMTNIVSATIFLTDIDDLPAVDSVYGSYFPIVHPARSVVEVQRLPGVARVQISVVAGR